MKKNLLYIICFMSFQMYSQTDNTTKKFTFKKLNNAIRLNYTLVDV